MDKDDVILKEEEPQKSLMLHFSQDKSILPSHDKTLSNNTHKYLHSISNIKNIHLK